MRICVTTEISMSVAFEQAFSGPGYATTDLRIRVFTRPANRLNNFDFGQQFRIRKPAIETAKCKFENTAANGGDFAAGCDSAEPARRRAGVARLLNYGARD
jgi:hypothetical protein